MGRIRHAALHAALGSAAGSTLAFSIRRSAATSPARFVCALALAQSNRIVFESRGTIEGLIAPSHSLKSTSANLGALSLSELAKRLEHGARGGTLGGEAPMIVAEIRRTFVRVQQELNALLTKSTA